MNDKLVIKKSQQKVDTNTEKEEGYNIVSELLSMNAFGWVVLWLLEITVGCIMKVYQRNGRLIPNNDDATSPY